VTPARAPAAAPASRCTCTACPLVCDDILPADGRFEHACDVGRSLLADTDATAPRDRGRPSADARSGEASADEPAAWLDGGPTDPAAAMAAAARLLAAARRVLVTGFGGATLEAATRACDVAEALDAAVDAGDADVARIAGPTIARVGEVSADWEELRDRADLVIFWLCDPRHGHPRFVERFAQPPTADGGRRRSILVGPAWAAPHPMPHDRLPLAAEAGVEAARCLDTLLGGRRLPASFPAADAGPAAVAAALAAAIDAARCVGIVTAHDADPAGLAAWSVVHLVRTIAHAKPAFEIPLGAADVPGGSAAGGHGAGWKGAAAVCTWRYGAAGAIDRADRTAARFLPGESSARRLLEREEVDAVLVAGRAAPAVEAALAAVAGRIGVVRIDDAPPAAGATEPRTIRLRCASAVAETPGTMLRGDGRTVALAPARPPRRPPLADVLAAVSAALAAMPRDAAAGAGESR